MYMHIYSFIINRLLMRPLTRTELDKLNTRVQLLHKLFELGLVSIQRQRGEITTTNYK